MEGFGLIVLIVIGVLFVIFATAKLKLHLFLSLIIAAFGIGIVAGLPLTDVVSSVNDGFGGLMGSIGLVIVFGTIIGVILEKSGAALRISNNDETLMEFPLFDLMCKQLTVNQLKWMKYYTLEDMSIKEMAFQGCVSENAVMLWGQEAKKELRKQYIFLYE